MRFANFFLSNRLRAWRDQEFYGAAMVLRQLAVDLTEQATRQIAELSKRDLLTRPGSFLSDTIGSMVREASEPIMLGLTERANRNLHELVAFNAVWAEAPADDPTTPNFEGWQDVALASAPLAGGVAAVATLPALAVTTTATMFGLVTTSTISWPVVVGGGVIASGLMATGVWNATQLVDRLRLRLQRKAKEQILATLIVGRKSKSLLEQYADILDQTVVQVRATR